MSWTVTLLAVECSSSSTPILDVHITNDFGLSVFTDSYGQAIVYSDTDLLEWVVCKFSKDGSYRCEPDHPDHHPGYVTRNFTVHKDMDGTTQTVCLNLAPLPDPDSFECTGVWPTPNCFIVTATTGSSESMEVRRLRDLRDRVSSSSRLGAQLIDVIYGEYEQFSSGIAAKLRKDAIVREAVLQIAVRPLFAWFTLAGTLAFEQADQKAIGQAAQDVLNACPQHLGGSSIITTLEAIRAGEALPTNTPPVLLDLVPRIAHLQFASWAILDPLIRAWRSATDHLDVVDEVAQWLATAPLEALSPPSDPAFLDVQLRVLADFLNFRPTVRPQLGERLLTAWPEAADALEHAGFVSQAQTVEKEE